MNTTQMTLARATTRTAGQSTAPIGEKRYHPTSMATVSGAVQNTFANSRSDTLRHGCRNQS